MANRVWRANGVPATVRPIEPEPVIDREEALATMFTFTDILAEVRRIRLLLEGSNDGEEEEGLSE